MIYSQDFLVDKSDEALLAELRRVAETLGKDTVTEDELEQHGRIKTGAIKKRFGMWNTALEKAGLRVGKRMNIPDEDISAEIGRVWSLLGHRPSREEFDKNATYSSALLKKRFGGYRKALALFLQQQDHSGQHRAASYSTRGVGGPSRSIASSKRSGTRRYGSRINFRGMQHAPLNELGVVFLFGMLAKDLGFEVEAIAAAFPDCEAKTLDKTGSFWERVDIEFEYKSTTFLKHGHDPSKCHLIVCWINDWKDCPIPVLELSREVERLSDRA
jgi:hypothetical protein